MNEINQTIYRPTHGSNKGRRTSFNRKFRNGPEFGQNFEQHFGQMFQPKLDVLAIFELQSDVADEIHKMCVKM